MWRLAVSWTKGDANPEGEATGWGRGRQWLRLDRQALWLWETQSVIGRPLSTLTCPSCPWPVSAVTWEGFLSGWGDWKRTLITRLKTVAGVSLAEHWGPVVCTFVLLPPTGSLTLGSVLSSFMLFGGQALRSMRRGLNGTLLASPLLKLL